MDRVLFGFENKLKNIDDILIEALSEVLEIDENSIVAEANFAEFGLDSLLALRFSRLVFERAGVQIELETLFDFPSIDLLSKELKDRSENLTGVCS